MNVDHIVIDFDSKPLLTFLEDYDNQVLSVAKMLEQKNCLTLTYEDDIQEDPRVGYRKICGHIGINACTWD